MWRVVDYGCVVYFHLQLRHILSVEFSDLRREKMLRQLCHNTKSHQTKVWRFALTESDMMDLRLEKMEGVHAEGKRGGDTNGCSTPTFLLALTR